MKDVFPIPIVDKLLDELFGAMYLSKLDLQYGCHQVLLLPEDTYKTTFQCIMALSMVGHAIWAF